MERLDLNLPRNPSPKDMRWSCTCMKTAAFRGKPHYPKNVDSPQINITPPGSKIYMKKQGKGPQITKTLPKETMKREVPYQLGSLVKLEKLKCRRIGSGRGRAHQWNGVEPRNRPAYTWRRVACWFFTCLLFEINETLKELWLTYGGSK